MDDLIAFIAARLNSEELAARMFQYDSEWDADMLAELFGRDQSDPVIHHLARYDPGRAMREVAAKRAVLAEHFAEGRGESLPGADCGVCYYIGAPGSAARWPCLTVRAIAAVWSGHPDYRDEWKP